MVQDIRYRPRRLGHVNMFVTDLWRSMDFYKSICGLDENARETSSGSGFLSNGNTHHDVGLCAIERFKRYLSNKGITRLPNHMDQPGLYHFGWEMGSEKHLVDAYRRALAAGLTPRVTDAATGRSNYLMDPDGFSHQFYADTEIDWRKVYIGGETILHSNPPWDPLATEPSAEPKFVERPRISRNPLSPIHQQRVTHGTMIVADIDASRRFYADICGFDIVGASRDGKAIQFASDASDRVVTIVETGEAPRMHHASFLLDPADDPAATVETLKRLEIDVVAHRREGHKESIFLRDPDGLLLEFYQPRDGRLDWEKSTVDADLPWLV
jgi:catechol 2,3-dioxygenase